MIIFIHIEKVKLIFTKHAELKSLLYLQEIVKAKSGIN